MMMKYELVSPGYGVKVRVTVINFSYKHSFFLSKVKKTDGNSTDNVRRNIIL